MIVSETKVLQLPEAIWKVLQEEQKETHPTLPLEGEYVIEMMTGSVSHEGMIPDPACPSGRRRIIYTIKFYVTITVTGQLVKDQEHERQYKVELGAYPSLIKMRIASHEMGLCIPI